ncbi:FAD-dependent oxidoreductase [Muricoccus radiodurans]|uniref:FAD-dependent oxidoreductase n=1 Tax=Muricoccus radiodurans TaxID=2231721 RepID=UPI003CFA5FCA
MTDRVDLLILGAGPAGMAAAVAGREQGLSVLLLDEGPSPGGQVYRALHRRDALDEQDAEGKALLAAFASSGAQIRHRATLWAVEDGERAFWSENGAAHSAIAGRIILAAGATERPVPIPGWTLPGVMGVGAAQIAMKTAGLVPEGKVWMAGQGPLMWLYAVQVIRKGGHLAGIIDLSPYGIARRLAPHLAAAWQGRDELLKGLRWQNEVRRSGTPVIRAKEIAAKGNGKLEFVIFDNVQRSADLLLLHDGVVPNTQITRAIHGCRHEWDSVQRCWKPVLDAWGNTTIPGVMVAGDGGGIAGAAAAALSGRLAALEAACAMGRLDTAGRDALAEPARLQLMRRLAVRPVLDAAFPPRSAYEIEDTTILCRCEEVTAGKVRDAVALGCLGTNQLKAFTRAGMGPCQGRVCGPAIHAVIAAERGVPPDEVEPLRTRFPTKPLTLGELASLAS